MSRGCLDGFDAGAAIMEMFGLGKGLDPLAQEVDELEEADEEELLDTGVGAGVAPMGVGMVHGDALFELLEEEGRLCVGGDT